MTTKKSDKVTKGAELSRIAKNYIISKIDGEGYGVTLNNDEEKIRFLADTFKKEYGWSIERNGVCKALAEWFSGLPSSCNIDFENYKILELCKEWRSIPENSSDAYKDKILNNWFNFIANKTMQLFRAYDIELN